MGATLTLYHGGVSGLVPGQKLLPPSLTDACSCADYDSEHCRADRVYLTTDVEEAAIYAALATPGGGGDVYEVEPLDELEPDSPPVPVTGSYAVRSATVVRVIRRGVRVEEAAARMCTSLLTLTTDLGAGAAWAEQSDAMHGKPLINCISVEAMI